MDTNGNYTKNQFCNYEIAVKLKELGFDEKCLAAYNLRTGELETYLYHAFDFNNTKHNIISAPLHQQVIDWFREKYDLHVVLTVNPYSEIKEVSGYKIYSGDEDLKCVSNQETQSWSFLKAREQAILKAIDLLKRS